MRTLTLATLLVIQTLVTITNQEVCKDSGTAPVDRVPPPWGPMLCSPGLDPKRHLNVRASDPESMKQVILHATMKDVGYTDKDLLDLKAPSKIGVIKPFKLLTDEGLRVAQNVIENELKQYEGGTIRIPRMIRAAAYRSKFFFDIMESEEVIGIVRQAFQADLIPHPIRFQNGHINLSLKNGRPVDRWHLDSVNFVFILCVRASNNTEHGRFRFVQKTKSDAEDLLATKDINSTGAIRDFFLKPGEVLMSQGSLVYHDVMGVPEEYGERISYILSFIPRKPSRFYDPMPHIMKLYNAYDPLHIILPEYAGYSAYKVADVIRAALQCGEDFEVTFAGANNATALTSAADKLEHLRWTIPYTENRTEIRNLLFGATSELTANGQSSKLIQQVFSKLSIVADEIDNLKAGKSGWKFIE